MAATAPICISPYPNVPAPRSKKVRSHTSHRRLSCRWRRTHQLRSPPWRPETLIFAQFVSVVSRQSLAEMNTHCRPQYYEGRFGIVKFDFIGRTEAMSRDLTYALERIEAPESIIARVNERHNVAGSSMELWDTVSAEVKRQFLATYEIDFDLLQYSRELRQPADLSCRRDRFSQPGQSRVGRRRRRSSDAVC